MKAFTTGTGIQFPQSGRGRGYAFDRGRQEGLLRAMKRSKVPLKSGASHEFPSRIPAGLTVNKPTLRIDLKSLRRRSWNGSEALRSIKNALRSLGLPSVGATGRAVQDAEGNS